MKSPKKFVFPQLTLNLEARHHFDIFLVVMDAMTAEKNSYKMSKTIVDLLIDPTANSLKTLFDHQHKVEIKTISC